MTAITEVFVQHSYDGGSTITDYKVFWDKGLANDVFELAGTTGGYLAYTFTATDDGLIAGRLYQFKVSEELVLLVLEAVDQI